VEQYPDRRGQSRSPKFIEIGKRGTSPNMANFREPYELLHAALDFVQTNGAHRLGNTRGHFPSLPTLPVRQVFSESSSFE
jgi:hypothetical protein